MLACLGVVAPARAEDGYRLWLRYEPVSDAGMRDAYRAALRSLLISGSSPTLDAARDELQRGVRGLLGFDLPSVAELDDGAVLLGTSASPGLAALRLETSQLGHEGYLVKTVRERGRSIIAITGQTDLGVLYGTFALLRHLQLGRDLDHLELTGAPRIQRRVLNHWDNLNGFIERGYAGNSLWDWFQLPEWIDPRLTDYARANASIGINGAVLNNVNANSLILAPEYLRKVAAIAQAFRPYGVRVYLSVRFSAPIDIGGLRSADPLDPVVREWWAAKAREIYGLIPDFGGWLVKANSEGEPGPRDYGRTHLDGANALADALAPLGGIVMWRAFVYEAEVPEDRAKQAYNEFVPQDGRFRPNVVLQVKNGPIDFMPREPFHPLFGAMPRTVTGLEVQITQEYLGGAVQVAFLALMWKEVLEADTHAKGAGSTVGRVVDGSLFGHELSLIAGVANTGDKRNWTGHPLAAANWYAFGRLAWDHRLDSESIADEWVRLTFSGRAEVVRTVSAILLQSHEAVVNYSMPLGLHHIMAEGHHHGPGPWVQDLPRPDWTSVYYHRADRQGIGFDRTATGSNAVSQYADPVAEVFADPRRCPDKYLLWFHHLPWDFPMKSGRPLWDELCLHYQSGVEAVREWQRRWADLEGQVDAERFRHVQALLGRQEREAREWRDACIQYFQTFSGRPLPPGVEPPEHPLDYHRSLRLRYAPGSADARRG